MENVVLGLLAHVDRGKTSLSESLLFESGGIKRKGRVDHGDSLLDHDELERKKGITIYAKSVYFSRENKRFFLLDTPGHREFSGEMERALQVLDYGILLLDMKEGIGRREKELWEMAKEAELWRSYRAIFRKITFRIAASYEKNCLRKEATVL